MPCKALLGLSGMYKICRLDVLLGLEPRDFRIPVTLGLILVIIRSIVAVRHGDGVRGQFVSA